MLNNQMLKPETTIKYSIIFKEDERETWIESYINF